MDVKKPVNPFEKLVHMLGQRIARQEDALADSRLQLEAAILSREQWQKDFVKEARK